MNKAWSLISWLDNKVQLWSSYAVHQPEYHLSCLKTERTWFLVKRKSIGNNSALSLWGKNFHLIDQQNSWSQQKLWIPLGSIVLIEFLNEILWHWPFFLRQMMCMCYLCFLLCSQSRSPLPAMLQEFARAASCGEPADWKEFGDIWHGLVSTYSVSSAQLDSLNMSCKSFPTKSTIHGQTYWAAQVLHLGKAYRTHDSDLVLS